MQEECAPIIAQPFPVLEYLLLAGFGYSADIREAAHPPLEIGHASLHLRLLEHDFRYPYLIRAIAFAPGKRPLMQGKPAEQGRGDALGCFGRKSLFHTEQYIRLFSGIQGIMPGDKSSPRQSLPLLFERHCFIIKKSYAFAYHPGRPDNI
jgi:hypothetical protein